MVAAAAAAAAALAQLASHGILCLEPVSQSDSQSVRQSVSQTVSQTVSQPVGHKDKQVSQSSHKDSQSANKSVGQQFNHVVCCFAEGCCIRPLYQLVTQQGRKYRPAEQLLLLLPLPGLAVAALLQHHNVAAYDKLPKLQWIEGFNMNNMGRLTWKKVQQTHCCCCCCCPHADSHLHIASTLYPPGIMTDLALHSTCRRRSRLKAYKAAMTWNSNNNSGSSSSTCSLMRAAMLLLLLMWLLLLLALAQYTLPATTFKPWQQQPGSLQWMSLAAPNERYRPQGNVTCGAHVQQ
jgi:hypothetical protein